MRYSFYFLVLLLVHLRGSAQNTIYKFKADSAKGVGIIDFASFQGKRILIVNAARQDSAFGQYNELLQLYKLYKDSLVIIVFPSNSFNNEPLDSSQLGQAYTSPGKQFIIAAKTVVTGAAINPLYAWLANASANGVMDAPLRHAFTKYLIGKNGQIKGVFNNQVSPMSWNIRRAIETGL
jgi:glutathione peroxidase-family protein